jgi:hypothetical protein
MGWLFPFLLAGLTVAGLWASKRLNRIALEFTAVAILIALAGYAWQGSPDLVGSPVTHAPSQ